MSSFRKVIVHYHMFKNAGSSIDQLLRRNFPDKWLSYDSDDAGAVITAGGLKKLIDENPQYEAFSSHQIVPPLPDIDGRVLPIVFVRDPIDRIRSAYLFEWKKQLGLDAPKGTLREYVESKFVHRRKSAIEEFQTIRLSNVDPSGVSKVGLADDAELYERASNFIKSLEFVGIVDQFDASCDLLKHYLSPYFPDFQTHNVQANVLQDISMPIAKKRDTVRAELGDEMYEVVQQRNALDDKLYVEALSHFNELNQLRADPLKEAV